MKKFVKYLLMLACVLALTACGAEPKTLDDQYDTVLGPGTLDTVLTYTTVVAYQDVSAIDEFNYNTLCNYNEDMLDFAAEGFTNEFSTALGMDLVIMDNGKTLVDAVGSYLGTKDEIGNPVIHVDQITITKGKKEIIVSLPLTGELHDGSFEVIYDKNLHVTSMTTNVMYSLEENMQNAATNTLIGMGTVFVMLIIIMIVIYILGALCGTGNAKKKTEKKDSDSVDKAIEGIVAREEATDDLELVAVISAAIAAAEGASSTDGFVVRSIKRIK